MSPQCPFEVAENTASFTTREILDLGLPVVYVSLDDENGAWQFNGPSMRNLLRATNCRRMQPTVAGDACADFIRRELPWLVAGLPK